MNNWLLIVVGVIFLVGMVVGGIRGFFKIGLSLLSSVLTIILVTLLPALASLVEIIGIGVIYNLSKEKTEKIYAELRARNELETTE